MVLCEDWTLKEALLCFWHRQGFVELFLLGDVFDGDALDILVKCIDGDDSENDKSKAVPSKRTITIIFPEVDSKVGQT